MAVLSRLHPRFQAWPCHVSFWFCRVQPPSQFATDSGLNCWYTRRTVEGPLCSYRCTNTEDFSFSFHLGCLHYQSSNCFHTPWTSVSILAVSFKMTTYLFLRSKSVIIPTVSSELLSSTATVKAYKCEKGRCKSFYGSSLITHELLTHELENGSHLQKWQNEIVCFSKSGWPR